MARRSHPHQMPTAAARVGAARERRDRGVRGPMVLAGPLSPDPPLTHHRRQDFDDLVVSVVEHLASRWEAELRDVEFGTEDVPQIPDGWDDEPVPLGSLVRPSARRPARIVLFRRPIELRARTRAERAALVHEVLVGHIGDLLGRPAEEIDP